MKLKKIASLMLADVMAVSMLAGCQNTNVDPEQPTDPIQPGTNGVSAAVEARVAANLDKINDEIPEYVTFQDSSDLDANLEYAVEYAGVLDIMPQYVVADELETVPVDYDIYNRLQVAVGDDPVDGVAIWNIGDVQTLEEAENVNSYEIDDEVAVVMYAISNAIGENAVNQMIAEQIDDCVADYEYSTRHVNNVGNAGGNYNHEYTVSISTYTKAVNSSIVGAAGIIGGAADPAVTFVAVQVVRTATHQ